MKRVDRFKNHRRASLWDLIIYLLGFSSEIFIRLVDGIVAVDSIVNSPTRFKSYRF